jgi:hypothetical protein
MALKPDRQLNRFDYDITKFFVSIDNGGERGGMAVLTANNAASGAAMDQTSNSVEYAAVASGTVPVGLLLADVVDNDLTKQMINSAKSEYQIGDKVPLAKRGEFVTNMIHPNTTAPANGEPCYLDASGLLSNVAPTSDDKPLVGRFSSGLDEGGYARVEIDILASL